MGDPTTPILFTLIFQDQSAQAGCLFDSVIFHHPASRRLVCLLEEECDSVAFADVQADILLVKDLIGAAFYTLAYHLTREELFVCILPLVITHLLSLPGAGVCIYLPYQSYLLGPLIPFLNQLDDRGAAIFSPVPIYGHSTDKEPTSNIDRAMAQVSVVGASAASESLALLNWWSDLTRQAFFGDQLSKTSVPFQLAGGAPGLFPGLKATIRVNSNSSANPIPSQHRGEAGLLEIVDFSELLDCKFDLKADTSNPRAMLKDGQPSPGVEHYLQLYARHSSSKLHNYGYSYRLIWQGKPIESSTLRAALRVHPTRQPPSTFLDFFDETPIEEVLQPQTHLPNGEMFPLSKLLYFAWCHLNSNEFHLFTGESRAKFLAWVLRGGHRKLDIDVTLLPLDQLSVVFASKHPNRLPLTPALWLLWLTDEKIRGASAPMDDGGVSSLIIHITKSRADGDIPAYFVTDSYLKHPVIGGNDDVVHVAAYAVWTVRKDLQAAFDLTTREGRLGLLNWLRSPSFLRDFPWLAGFKLMAIPVSAGIH